MLAHKGEKAYANTFDLIYRRTADRPNYIWQADHTLLDIWVLDHRDHPARPWLTAIMDDLPGRCIPTAFTSRACRTWT